jgi:hypothetical protein
MFLSGLSKRLRRGCSGFGHAYWSLIIVILIWTSRLDKPIIGTQLMSFPCFQFHNNEIPRLFLCDRAYMLILCYSIYKDNNNVLLYDYYINYLHLFMDYYNSY